DNWRGEVFEERRRELNPQPVRRRHQRDLFEVIAQVGQVSPGVDSANILRIGQDRRDGWGTVTFGPHARIQDAFRLTQQAAQGVNVVNHAAQDYVEVDEAQRIRDLTDCLGDQVFLCLQERSEGVGGYVVKSRYTVDVPVLVFRRVQRINLHVADTVHGF